MFDVDLARRLGYRESKMFHPGDQAVLAPTPWGPLGMTICYDLRFPQLYRDLAQAGARLLTVPSAFTKITGDAHWEMLLRARAIESGAFVFAPCQTGSHPGKRRTCGHSLIIDPWGVVLADGGTEVGFVTAKWTWPRSTASAPSCPRLTARPGLSPARRVARRSRRIGAQVSLPGGDALDRAPGRAFLDDQIFVGQHAQFGRGDGEQFAGLQQESRDWTAGRTARCPTAKVS